MLEHLDGCGSDGACHHCQVEEDCEYSHPDRVAEWRTTALTKCMLSKVVDGSEIDEASLNACEQAVNFAYDVGTLDRKSQIFAELTAADKFTCSEDHIKFRGETWRVPQGEAPASSEYTTESFLPEVSLAKGTTPFGFCTTAASGSLAQADAQADAKVMPLTPWNAIDSEEETYGNRAFD